MKKKEARLFYQNLRNELTIEDIKNLSLKIINNFINHFETSNKTISVFLPIISKREINTTILFSLATNFKIVIPKWDEETNQLTHYLYEPNKTTFITSKFGIQEPENGEIITPENIDYVLTPLLAVDQRGIRVGYGKGVYDSFFNNCTAETVKIGLHYFNITQKIEDVNDFDVPLNYCITPEKIFQFE
jgi:5-formyltetrahydrofolate cyclo-ligase